MYPDEKICHKVKGFNAASLYLYNLGQEMPCGKEEFIEMSNPQNPRVIKDLCGKVLADELFRFLHVPARSR